MIEVTNILVAKFVESVDKAMKEFLKIVCKSAMEELGLWMADKVRYWRLSNVYSMLEKVKWYMMDPEKFMFGEAPSDP